MLSQEPIERLSQKSFPFRRILYLLEFEAEVNDFVRAGIHPHAGDPSRAIHQDRFRRRERHGRFVVGRTQAQAQTARYRILVGAGQALGIRAVYRLDVLCVYTLAVEVVPPFAPMRHVQADLPCSHQQPPPGLQTSPQVFLNRRPGQSGESPDYGPITTVEPQRGFIRDPIQIVVPAVIGDAMGTQGFLVIYKHLVFVVEQNIGRLDEGRENREKP